MPGRVHLSPPCTNFAKRLGVRWLDTVFRPRLCLNDDGVSAEPNASANARHRSARDASRFTRRQRPKGTHGPTHSAAGGEAASWAAWNGPGQECPSLPILTRGNHAPPRPRPTHCLQNSRSVLEHGGSTPIAPVECVIFHLLSLPGFPQATSTLSPSSLFLVSLRWLGC